MTEDEDQEEFEKYCRETQIPKVFFAIFGIMVALLAGIMYRGF